MNKIAGSMIEAWAFEVFAGIRDNDFQLGSGFRICFYHIPVGFFDFYSMGLPLPFSPCRLVQ